MNTKANQEKLVDILKAWQQVENRSAAQSEEIVERTRNPVIRLVTEIIRRDAAMHYRVQQFLIDSIENQAVNLTVDDLVQVWAAIETHIEAERKTVELIAGTPRTPSPARRTSCSSSCSRTSRTTRRSTIGCSRT